MESENVAVDRRVPWNKGKLTGQTPPLKLREIWAIRTRIKMASNIGNSRCSISQSIASFELEPFNALLKLAKQAKASLAVLINA